MVILSRCFIAFAYDLNEFICFPTMFSIPKLSFREANISILKSSFFLILQTCAIYLTPWGFYVVSVESKHQFANQWIWSCMPQIPLHEQPLTCLPLCVDKLISPLAKLIFRRTGNPCISNVSKLIRHLNKSVRRLQGGHFFWLVSSLTLPWPFSDLRDISLTSS